MKLFYYLLEIFTSRKVLSCSVRGLMEFQISAERESFPVSSEAFEYLCRSVIRQRPNPTLSSRLRDHPIPTGDENARQQG